MKPLSHIACLAALAAAPAQAESPALCHGDTLEGWFLNQASGLPNGFVQYYSFRNKGNDRRHYLEHCASGQTLRVEYTTHWTKTDEVGRHFDKRIQAKAPITQKQLAKELGDMGAQTTLYKSKVESCACHNILPDTQGAKAAYAGEWQ